MARSQELGRNQEYLGCSNKSSAYGIDIERSINVHVNHNDVTAYATECEAHALRIIGESYADPDGTGGPQPSQWLYSNDVRVANNTFKTVVATGKIGSAISLMNITNNLIDVDSNTFESNGFWVWSDGNVLDMQLQGNVWNVGAGVDLGTWKPLQGMNWRPTAGQAHQPATKIQNLTLIDNLYGANARTEMEGAQFQCSYNAGAACPDNNSSGQSTDLDSSFSLNYSVTVTVKDGTTGQPVGPNGGQVWFTNAQSVNSSTINTDSSGKVAQRITPEWEMSASVATHRSPYVVHAKITGTTREATASLNVDSPGEAITITVP